MLQNNGNHKGQPSGNHIPGERNTAARYTSGTPIKTKRSVQQKNSAGTHGTAKSSGNIQNSENLSPYIKGEHSESIYGVSERNPFLAAKKCNLPAVIVVAVMVLYLISEILLSGNYINSANPYITVVIAQFCVYLIPCAFFFAFSPIIGRTTPRDFGFRTPPVRLLGFGVSSLFVLVFGGMLIKYTGYLMFGTVSSSAVSVTSSGDFLYILLSGIIVPAITEEILFRGVVLGVYERTLGSFTAILASSVLFAFIHFDSVNFVSYLYAGIILGISATVTRSVVVPVILHFLNNFICIFSDTYLQRISKESISTVFVVFILAVLCLAVLFFYFESLELYCREMALDTNRPQNKSPKLFVGNESKIILLSRAFLAPSFIVALAVYLIKVLTM